MKLHVLQHLLADVPAEWEKQYQWETDKAKLEITKQLQAMEPPYTIDEIERIIGNDSWTSIWCDECEEKSDMLVELGDNHEDGARYICRRCLVDAFGLIDKEETRNEH